jgi:hypothetical protein
MTSSVAALVMARTAQRVALENGDEEMLAEATEYENRALAAIKLHLPELPDVEKPATVTGLLTGGHAFPVRKVPRDESQ